MKQWLTALTVAAASLAVVISDAAGSDGVPGVKTLRPCPASPNCVSSRADDPRQRMAPIPFAGTRDQAQERLRACLTALPRTEITSDEPGYLAVQFRSRLFGFVDEAEFILDDGEGVIHFRSGARTGYYDFGVNRARIEQIAAACSEGN